MSYCFYSGNPETQERGSWVCWWVFSLNLDQQSLAQITGPPPQVHSGGTAALSHRWHNKLWATSGAVETWGPQTPRLGPWIMRSSLSLLLSFPTRNSSLLLSVSLCHLSYYHLKALWQHPVCRVTSPLRILGIHCLAAFSGPLHGYFVWSPGWILEWFPVSEVTGLLKAPSSLVSPHSQDTVWVTWDTGVLPACEEGPQEVLLVCPSWL